VKKVVRLGSLVWAHAFNLAVRVYLKVQPFASLFD